MDKYIKMLLIKLSPKYKVTITTIMSYDPEREKFNNTIKLTLKHKFSGEVHTANCCGKQGLVCEMMKWLKD